MKKSLCNYFSAALLLASLAGCRSNKTTQELPPSIATTTVAYYRGTPLSGPSASAGAPVSPPAPTPAVATTAPSQGRAPEISVSFVALEHLPALGDSIDNQTRLIVSPQNSSLIIAAGQLLPRVHGLELSADQSLLDALPPDIGRSAQLSSFDSAALPGITAAFALRDPLEDAAAPPTSRSITLLVYHAPDRSELELGLMLNDWFTLLPSLQDQPQAPERKAHLRGSVDNELILPRQLRLELALFDPQPVKSRRLALIIPFKLAGMPTDAVAVVIDINPASTNPQYSELAADIAQKATAASQGETPDQPSDFSDWPEVKTALDAMADPSRRRAATVFLARQSGARILADTALVADDLILEQLVLNLQASIRALSPAQHDQNALATTLERTTLNNLYQLMISEKLPPELQAVLIRAAGEAGRQAGSLEQVITNMTSPADMDQRLITENLIYLEDASPSARIRATRWLNQRHKAPKGFDPLASPEQRRKALDATETE